MAFSVQTLNFLFENRLHDSRDWYNEHKDDYRAYVAAPFSALIEAFAPTMAEIDAEIVCNPKKFSRLWRDARFAKGDSLFRDNVWCSFGRKKEPFEMVPEFYFELSPNGFSYGCGYYAAGTKTMEAMRGMILSGDKTAKAALSAYAAQRVFTLGGELYKKNRYPDAEEVAATWLNRRSVYLFAGGKDFDLLFSEALAEKIAADFRAIAPVYRMFRAAEARSKE
ncbi:MAG: DUF2461 domain-containing protein [Oscillospiraceae bacterium]